LKQKLPDYMVPSAFQMLDLLPLNASGKVDRKALPDVKLSSFEPDKTYVPPQDELEEALVRIWQGVLKVEKVGTQDNFFDLGGHSLLMMQVNRKLKEVIGRTLPLVELFRYPTIRMLAQSLNPHLDKQAPPEHGGSRGQARREAIIRRQKPRESVRFGRSHQGI
jgi:aryl carrier-like protein